MEVVGEAGTVADAIRRVGYDGPERCDGCSPAPDGSGVEACREVRSRWPNVQVLMLTSYADEEALVAAVMAGAAGYVLKRIDVADLVSSIRRVGEGEPLLDPAMTERLLQEDQRGRRGTSASRKALTAREEDPQPHRGGSYQQGDRRRAVSRREDRKELRIESAWQAGNGKTQRSGCVRSEARREARPAIPPGGLGSLMILVVGIDGRRSGWPAIPPKDASPKNASPKNAGLVCRPYDKPLDDPGF